VPVRQARCALPEQQRRHVEAAQERVVEPPGAAQELQPLPELQVRWQQAPEQH